MESVPLRGLRGGSPSLRLAMTEYLVSAQIPVSQWAFLFNLGDPMHQHYVETLATARTKSVIPNDLQRPFDALFGDITFESASRGARLVERSRSISLEW